MPAKHFAVGPYRAEQVGPTWWGVMNKTGVNVLTFPDRPGAVVTNEAHAKEIAEYFNSIDVFEYPPSTYAAPATQRMTDAEMANYVRSRTYNPETKRWG